jgi:hypothetical protein
VTQLLDRPRTSAPQVEPPESVAPLWVRGSFAAVWSAAVGLALLIVVALIDWAADSTSSASAGGAMRFAVDVWLAAGRTPLGVPGGHIAVAPLGLTILLGLLIARAASMLAKTAGLRDLGQVGVVAGSVAVPYAVISALLCLAGRSGSIHPSVGAAFVTEGLFAAVAAGAGALRGAGLFGAAWQRVPDEGRRVLRASGWSALVLVVGGSVLLVGSLFAHSGVIREVLDNYHGGTGVFAVVLLSILLVPNAVLFAVSYLTGTGFAVGAGASVGFTSAHVGAVPALPIIAAAPHGRAPVPVTAMCIVIAIAAGVTAAVLIERESERALTERMVTLAWTVGTLLVGAAILAALAGGPAGPGTLRAFGPSPWQVALSLGFEVGVVAAVVMFCRRWVAIARDLLGRGR